MRDGLIDRAPDELLGQASEGQASGQQPSCGIERRIGGVQVAEVNLALVPATGAGEWLVRRVEERDSNAVGATGTARWRCP